MENHSIFTFLKKYSFIGLILLLLLSGCQGNNPIDANSTGFFDHYFVYPFSLLIKYLASLLGGDYGLSIILMTILIRLLLMPLSLKQMKSSVKMKDKMGAMKPEMDAIKEKYKDKKDAKVQMQQEMSQLYQKHNMNPLTSIGCLPLIIQFPIIIAFYYAIRRTPEIATHSFLWFNLGQVDFVLPFVAAAVYFIQSRVSLIGMDEKQRKQMAIMGLLSPVMIGFISFNMPAALPLYWAVSGSFLVLQTLLSKKLYQANT